SPVLQPCSERHSFNNCGPAARWIAPSTPPPPRSELLAALTIASTAKLVISLWRALRVVTFDETRPTTPNSQTSSVPSLTMTHDPPTDVAVTIPLDFSAR